MKIDVWWQMDIQYSTGEAEKKCSIVQSLATKIERMSPSRIDRQEESLNKRVNLALGHASMYCCVK